jgi:ribosomal protein L12E/L44/L45/RPP1/RPP2
MNFTRMRYVAAYLLAVLGGKEQPSEADVKKILSSVGIDVDAGKLKKVIDELKGKKLEEVLAAGKVHVPLSEILCVLLLLSCISKLHTE